LIYAETKIRKVPLFKLERASCREYVAKLWELIRKAETTINIAADSKIKLHKVRCLFSHFYKLTVL